MDWNSFVTNAFVMKRNALLIDKNAFERVQFFKERVRTSLLFSRTPSESIKCVPICPKRVLNRFFQLIFFHGDIPYGWSLLHYRLTENLNFHVSRMIEMRSKQLN